MPYYDPMSGMEVETEEERKKRIEEAANTEIAKKEVTTYADGSQTHTTTQEIPSPSFFDKLGTAVSQAGSNFVTNLQNAPGNFVNNVKQGVENVSNIPQNFATNVQNIPERIARPMPVRPVSPQDYSLTTSQGGPGMRVGQVFAPQQTVAPGNMPQMQPSMADQARYTQQMESGNNPNIGYHYQPNEQGQRKSTAYGAYGITDPAYADVQRANPQFANRPIESLTPQEQQQAFNTYNQLNGQRLQQLGVEPTEGNQRLAYLLGANGAARFLQTGEVSPQAAAANGGVERLKQIAQQRVAGAPTALSSGAATNAGNVSPQQLSQQPAMAQPVTTQPTQATPTQAGIEAYQAAQNNITDLMKLNTNENIPEYIRTRAGDRALELYDNQKKERQATEEFKNLDAKGIADVAQGRSKSSVGDWLQYLLFKHVGLNDLANEKGDQLGIGHKWQGAMDANGNTGMIRYSASGKPLEGVKADGSAMSSDDLAAYASQGLGKASDVSLTPFQAMVNGELHTFNVKRTPNGVMYQDATAGTSWSRTAPAGMTHVGQQDPAHVKGLSAANSVVTKMSKANADAVGAGGRPLYSADQIQQARNDAYTAVTGKTLAGAPAMANAPTAPVANAPATTAPAAAPTTAPTANAPKTNAPKSQAQAILDYDSPPPVGPTSPAKIAIMNEVQRLAAEQGKTYDAGRFKIISKTKQDFTTGKQGQAVQSMNVAVDHLDTLAEAGRALQNGNMPLFNQIGNMYSKNTGSPQVTDFNALKTIVGSEVAKAVAGGATALGDREEIRKEIDAANSPQQLAGVINKYQRLMAGQVKGLKQTYESAGLNDFDNKLLPRTKKVLNEIEPPSRSKW